jgi:HNH endonuclease
MSGGRRRNFRWVRRAPSMRFQKSLGHTLGNSWCSLTFPHSAGHWSAKASDKAAPWRSAGVALTEIRAERPRFRLDAEAYRQLCHDVLERDSWRCQQCGRMKDLQVHHIVWRSHLGDDTTENLITLCASCHQEVHRQGQGTE